MADQTLLTLLDEVRGKTLALLETVAESRHQTVRRKIVHAIHDEACHSGEIWLLRKMFARQSTSLGRT